MPVMNDTKQLNENVSIPILGFGTWQLRDDECSTAVEHAIASGFRHIDTADRYENHHAVAAGIQAAGVPRDELFLTTKLWRDDLTAAAVQANVDRFLDELATDYIDLLLIHWPNRDVPIEETLQAMDTCRTQGKIRAIGVSNFTEHHIADALATGVPIVNNQVEVRPQFNQEALVQYCAEHDISVTAYSMLQSDDMELPLIAELAAKYERTPAQIILNWSLSRGLITLSKSRNPERIRENLAALEFQMTKEDIKRITALPQGERFNDPTFGDFSY